MVSPLRLAYLDPYTVPAYTPSAMQILQMAEALAEAGFPAPMPAQNVVVTQNA